MEENRITIGTTTYIISRQFDTGQQITRQTLLSDLIARKLKVLEAVDPTAAHTI